MLHISTPLQVELLDVVVHNPTGMAHPMHLHGAQFYFLGTSGIDLNNAGKDPATGKMKYTPPPEEPAMMNYDAPVVIESSSLRGQP